MTYLRVLSPVRDGWTKLLGYPPLVRVFAAALACLLAGYMFLGRGFAHIGVGPIYVGDVVLVLGLVAAATAWARGRSIQAVGAGELLILAFIVLGVVRTIPYIHQYGIDALRDGVLWGYALFALILVIVGDRTWLFGATRVYGAVLPIFAIWLPIAWLAFANLVTPPPNAIASDIPILFFKNQDMAVHATGAIAFLVILSGTFRRLAGFLWRFVVSELLAWAIFVTGSVSRGALVAFLSGLTTLVVVVGRSRAWLPVVAAVTVLVVALSGPGILSLLPSVGPTPTPIATPATSGTPTETATPSVVAVATPEPSRGVSAGQWIDNIASVISPSKNDKLEGTKDFRIAWWSKIVSYTVFGPYIWTGKGFGVNLADSDGFQITPDHSLRAPHNSHLSVLAREGVLGFLLWVLLQGWFGLSLLWSSFRLAQRGDGRVAAVGLWLLVYWVAMMVNTTFDPYLEGPQGGIWFWSIVGLGLIVIRTASRSRDAASPDCAGA